MIKKSNKALLIILSLSSFSALSYEQRPGYTGGDPLVAFLQGNPSFEYNKSSDYLFERFDRKGYYKYINNELEYESRRNDFISNLKESVKNKSLNFPQRTDIAVGKYDFDKKGFPLYLYQRKLRLNPLYKKDHEKSPAIPKIAYNKENPELTFWPIEKEKAKAVLSVINNEISNRRLHALVYYSFENANLDGDVYNINMKVDFVDLLPYQQLYPKFKELDLLDTITK